LRAPAELQLVEPVRGWNRCRPPRGWPPGHNRGWFAPLCASGTRPRTQRPLAPPPVLSFDSFAAPICPFSAPLSWLSLFCLPPFCGSFAHALPSLAFCSFPMSRSDAEDLPRARHPPFAPGPVSSSNRCSVHRAAQAFSATYVVPESCPGARRRLSKRPPSRDDVHQGSSPDQPGRLWPSPARGVQQRPGRITRRHVLLDNREQQRRVSVVSLGVCFGHGVPTSWSAETGSGGEMIGPTCSPASIPGEQAGLQPLIPATDRTVPGVPLPLSSARACHHATSGRSSEISSV